MKEGSNGKLLLDISMVERLELEFKDQLEESGIEYKSYPSEEGPVLIVEINKDVCPLEGLELIDGSWAKLYDEDIQIRFVYNKNLKSIPPLNLNTVTVVVNQLKEMVNSMDYEDAVKTMEFIESLKNNR